ncbi:EAL domain-containing protein [Sulfoacidibacillus thermotolerans]|uniref:EAL domain-containing protein n=1 Tax=Sulfoacidibacillus thermotolerans TaxID=1765684 RepID=A0A2U3D748_SULT2|nr:EAL domain-containing protein [Sulfoacidibacillus thermotolerans]PWI57105.1 hypothetical protein BM613_10120 [Sulfoacidibacillus thermotolerans]
MEREVFKRSLHAMDPILESAANPIHLNAYPREEAMYVQEVLESSSLYSVYQPIVDHVAQKVQAHEALSRPHWNGQMLQPDTWFQTSVAQKRQIDADRLAVQTALRQFQCDVLTSKQLFLNVMPTSLLDLTFVKSLERSLRKELFDPAWIVIELIEYVPYHPLELKQSLRELRSLGIRFALDDIRYEGCDADFLRKLSILEPEYIKIDRSLIQGISRSAKQQDQLHALLQQVPFHDRIIAEGVEERADVDQLISFGIRLSQGYYWSEPLSMLRIL